MANTWLWTDKYAPKKLDDVIGQTNVVETVKRWAEVWKKAKKQKPLLLHGPTGIGKTALVLALAEEHDYELLELNASDVRNAERINRIAGLASVSKTLSGKQRLILFDEIDGLFGSQDRGGASAVLKVIKQAECLVILTANDIWNPKLSSIKSNTTNVAMKKVHYATIGNYLEKIAKKEKKNISKKTIVEIARTCSGDVRSAINDLQMLTQVDDEDLEVLGERDRQANIFSAVMTILKTKQFKKSRESLFNLAEDPDFVLKWIDENIPKEYKKPEELYEAMEKISRADVYLGRVMKRQQYTFWKYASDMMSAGVSLSKESTYPGFTRYSFPSMIKGLSASRGRRATRKSIALKIGKTCHVSSSTAIQDYLPMFAELMKKKDGAVKLTAQFDFNEKELEFFDVKSSKKVISEAAQIRTKAIIEARTPKPGSGQKGLSHFT